MTTKTVLTKGIAGALVLATAMSFATVNTAEARHRGNAAAGALFGLAAGAIIGGIIAHENDRRYRRHYYYDRGYNYGPRYYGNSYYYRSYRPYGYYHPGYKDGWAGHGYYRYHR